MNILTIILGTVLLLIVCFCLLFVICTGVVAWQLERQRIETSESRFVSQTGVFIGGFILGMWFAVMVAGVVYK